MYDNTGNVAASNVDRWNEIVPIKWHLETADATDNAIKVSVKYRPIKANPYDYETIEFLFNKKKMLGLFSKEPVPYRMINIQKKLATKRDIIRFHIDESLRQTAKEYSDYGYSKAMEKFISFKHELRKAAVCEAIIYLMRKPKSWDECKSLLGFSS
jgi:hypothetical protein